MKNKIAIVTDSSSSLDYIPHDKEHIFMTRMPIHFGGDDYVDGITITVEEFYERLKMDPTIPSTSQPPLGETLELYERLKVEGYTDVIHLPISKGISGTYQSLFSIQDSVEGLNVHILDTKCTALILGHMVIESAKMVKEGKSVEEITHFVNHMANNFKAYFMVDDLKYLIKNGRLSNAAGFIGSMLKIKPIITFNDEGEIVGTDKIRTTKKAMQFVIDAFNNDIKKYKKVLPFISYGGDEELRDRFKEQVSERTSVAMYEFFESILPSVIAAHVGPRIVALGYFIIEE